MYPSGSRGVVLDHSPISTAIIYNGKTRVACPEQLEEDEEQGTAQWNNNDDGGREMLSFSQQLTDHASDSCRAGKFVEVTDFSRNSSLDRFDRFDRTG